MRQTGPLWRDGAALEAVEWAIPLVLVDLLFSVFVWVQVTVLFGGHDYVLATGGPDYATYARGGFAQLGVVTGIDARPWSPGWDCGPAGQHGTRSRPDPDSGRPALRAHAGDRRLRA